MYLSPNNVRHRIIKSDKLKLGKKKWPSKGMLAIPSFPSLWKKIVSQMREKGPLGINKVR